MSATPLTQPAAPAVPRTARLRRVVGTAAVALGAGTLGAVVAPNQADVPARDGGAPAHALSVSMHSEEERATPAPACRVIEAAPANAEPGRVRRARTLALHWWSW